MLKRLRAVGQILLAAGHALHAHLGSREIAILGVALGVFLAARPTLPEGAAAGLALIAAGGLLLWAATGAQKDGRR